MPPSVSAVLIDHPKAKIKFLVCDSPTDEYIEEYKNLWLANKVEIVFRIAGVYSTSLPLANGIRITDEIKFEDGGVPTEANLERWRAAVAEIENDQSRPTVAIHCIGGVGRAPALVAVALVDAGVAPEDAIEFIRNRRRGSLNRKQISWICEDLRRKKGFFSNLFKKRK